MNARENGVESSPMTTRIAVVDRVAAGWLASHPEVAVTTGNLAKTLQQMLTEVFLTGQERCRGSLSDYAASLIDAAGVDLDEVASARMFSKSADLPACYATVFAELSKLLAPLAAAVQLSRSALADAAFSLVKGSGNRLGITRLHLRGFVEAQVRPHALRIHQRVGYDRSAQDYLRLVLEDTERLAVEILAAAGRKATQSTCLGDQARAGFEQFFRSHGAQLSTEAKKYGADADEMYSRAIQKLAIAYRNNPDLDADLAYAKKVLKSVWSSLQQERANRPELLVEEFERAKVREPVQDDSGDQIAAVDAIVRRLLGTAESLRASTTPEATLASKLLIEYFFADPTICDPRRAELTGHVWELADTKDGAELEKGLCELAKKLFSTANSAARIAKMVIKALRHGKGGLDEVE